MVFLLSAIRRPITINSIKVKTWDGLNKVAWKLLMTLLNLFFIDFTELTCTKSDKKAYFICKTKLSYSIGVRTNDCRFNRNSI